MKKLCAILAMLMMIGTAPVSAADATVIETYVPEFNTVQGVNGWSYCGFTNDGAEELSWGVSTNTWAVNEQTKWPYISRQEMNTATGMGVGYQFVAPEKGMVRLVGAFWADHEGSEKSNGIGAHVCKGKDELWSALVKNDRHEFEVITPVKEGEKLFFYGDANGSNSNDWFHIAPRVEYLDMQYESASEGVGIYFEKVDGTLKELEFDEKTERYNASDGVAFICKDKFMASGNCTLVKRYKVQEDTRYRVTGTIKSFDVRNGGTIVTIKKNDDIVWQQLVLKTIPANIDVRMRAQEGDIIDVELNVAEYTGFNYSEWDLEVGPFYTTGTSTASTSQDFSYSVIEEIKLSSLAGKTSEDGVKFYSQIFKRQVPMQYDSAQKKWVSTIERDTGYISANKVYPGNHCDSVIEYTVKRDGYLRIDGNLKPNAGDGVLSKIFQNDELVWSSRVGEEGPVKWDEPYDVSYFRYDIGVVMNVNAGDVIKFSFNQWRLVTDDTLKIDDVTLKYISGQVLSKTTKWKIANSTLIDVVDKVVYKNGETFAADVIVYNGTTYIAKSEAIDVLGNDTAAETVVIDNKEYLPVRKIAEESGKFVTWGLERFVIVHDSIPGFFGWQELSEMNTALKGDVLFD